MKNYRGHYYSTRVSGYASRNNITPIVFYQWVLRTKQGDELSSSGTEEYTSKDEAESACETHIEERYFNSVDDEA